MSTPYPPALSPSQLTSLLDLAIDWSLAHGLVVRPKQAHLANNAAVTHAPYSLFPSRYPRSAFDQAVRLQPIWNELIHKISEDEAFLAEIMTDLSQIDDFVGNLYDIYLAVRREGIAQPVSLGLHRCDYLLHVPLDSNLATTIPVIQQVEFNTISSSFGSLSTLTGQMHRYLLAATNYYVEPGNIIAEQLPENESIKSIAKGIAKAWEVYGKKSAITLMVVQPNERNAFDQRWIEYNLLEKLGPFHLSFLTSDVGELELQFFYTHSASSSRPNSHHVRLIRRTLAEIAELASLDPETKALIIDGHEIAVTYFRSGYGPGDYSSGKEWAARLLLERSLSIKSPTIAYQLTGSKKVQQVLASPRVLERFLSSAQADDLRVVFAGLYPLDASSTGRAALEAALREPHKFVLKPQREGGGNNVYGEDIRKVLEGLGERERSKFILMDLIRSPPFRGYMVREGQLIDAQVVSELGIFGIFLGSGPTVLLNETGGHLLRTKSHESNEGGVAAGFAVIDSPLLV